MSLGLSTSQTQPSRGSEYQVTNGTTKQPQNSSSGTHSQPKYIGRTVAPEPAQQHMQAGSSQHEESTHHQSSGAYKIEAAPHPEIKTSLKTTKMDNVSSITMDRMSPLSVETFQTGGENLTTAIIHSLVHQDSENNLEKCLDIIEKHMDSMEDNHKKLGILHSESPPIQQEKDRETELNHPKERTCLTETTELGATMTKPPNDPEIPISSISEEQLDLQRKKLISRIKTLASWTENLELMTELLTPQTKLRNANTKRSLGYQSPPNGNASILCWTGCTKKTQ